MPKPPLNERIKALEDANMLLIEKINRMKAQVRHNQKVIEKYQERMAKEQPQPKTKREPAKPRVMTPQEQNDALAAYFANKRKT